jgi:Ion channel
MEALADWANWFIVVATIFVIGVCVFVHYEVLLATTRLLPVVSRRRPPRVVYLILIILLAHAVEIWLFAFGYYLLGKFDTFGDIEGAGRVVSMLEYAYFSGMVYSTVGFGDLLPTGPIRFMAGMEALTGLVMITWSASYTFLEMQRDWPGRQPDWPGRRKD